MNYSVIYDALINRAKLEVRKKAKGGVYYEKHHILPICLNGSDSKENLVLLTAREHFIAHKLLVEIYPNNSKLWNATWMMVTKAGKDRDYRVSSREYERFKIEVCNNLSKSRVGKKSSQETRDKISLSSSGENNPMYGKIGELNPNTGSKRSSEFKIKISIIQHNFTEEKKQAKIDKLKAALTGIKKTPEQRENMRIGQRNSLYVHTKEHNMKISKSLKIIKNTPENKEKARLNRVGKKNSPETREKLRIINTGVVFSKERCENISKGLTDRKHSEAEIEANRIRNTGVGNGMYGKKQKILTCIYCGKQGGNGAFVRFHNENCKFKDILITVNNAF